MELSMLVFRWLHVLFGIVWIGMLYYFNFVQTEYFKEAESSAKSDALRKLAPRGLWWFRWGAMLTFITGLVLLLDLYAHRNGWSLYIVLGAVLGTVMWANVWFRIWPMQKIVISNAERLARGEEGLPEAADALAKAGLASRHNTLFSVPMLFFMVASAHGAGPGARMVLGPAGGNASWAALAIGLIAIALLEYNAIRGKLYMLAEVKGVIHLAFWLTLLLFLVSQFI